jgi:hypothetical protein
VITAVLEAAVAVLEAQERKGLSRYGTTLEDANLPALEILTHAREEAADSLMYLTACLSAVQVLEEENARLRARVGHLEHAIKSVLNNWSCGHEALRGAIETEGQK